MGLDTTHDCWHGAYRAFNRWRDALAEVAGYTFHEIGTARQQVDLDWGGIEATIGRDLNGKWAAIPVRPDGTPDPLIILLAHSDNEGELQAEFLDAIADRLEELIPLLGEKDGGGHVGSLRRQHEEVRCRSAVGVFVRRGRVLPMKHEFSCITGASPGQRLAPLYGRNNRMTKPFPAWLRPPLGSSPENAGVPVCSGFAPGDLSGASRVHHEDSV